jgi:TrmH family RNA methyltransferase
MLSKTHFSYIRSLHLKKNRDAENVFIAEGSKVVMELLVSGNFLCRELIAVAGWYGQYANAGLQAGTARVSVADPGQLNALSLLKANRDVIAIFEKNNSSAQISHSPFTLMLNGIRDPGNLGTIIRIADWFGIGTLVCSPGTADCYNPKVVQSAMGSLARVSVVYTDPVGWIQAHAPMPVFAAVVGGMPVSSAGQVGSGLLIIGSESQGIDPSLLALATVRIGIPGAGKAESLNAAVATGIILSHLIQFRV